MDNFDVAIVGGGAAGLAALRELGASSLKVVLLEARPELGGRVRRVDGHDAGAAWVHGTHNNVLVREATGVELRAVSATNPWCDPFAVAKTARVLRDGRLLTDAEVDVDARTFATRASRVADDARAAKGWDTPLGLRGLDGRHARLLELWMGANVANLQLREFESFFDGRFGDHPGPHALPGAGGMTRVLRNLVDTAAPRSLLSSPVREIRRTDAGGVQVAYGGDDRGRGGGGGGVLSARACIVALPLGVLKRDAGSSVGVVAAPSSLFVPPLPASKRGPIDRLGVGSYTKVFCSYRSAWWRRPLPSPRRPFLYLETGTEFLALVDRGAVFDDDDDDGEVVLEATVAGDHAASLDAGPPEDAVAYVRAMLEANFTDVEAPTKTLVTNWNADPFALGAYSFWPVGARDTDVDDLATPQPPLFFAGEATSVDFQGSLTGALESGLRAAKEVQGFLSAGER